MFLFISGNRPKQYTKQELKYACQWFAKHLINKRLRDKICVDIILSDKLVKEDKCYGLCSPEDFAYRHKFFSIHIDSTISKRMMLRTICHELVHVSQYARARLKNTRNWDKVKWEGKIVSVKYEKRANDEEGCIYFSNGYEPWEVEARDLEDKFFRKYKRVHGSVAYEI